MEFVTMFDELLLPVFVRVNRGFEIANFWCLECRTKRAQRCIYIIGLFSYRTIIDSPGKLDRIPSWERCSNCMSRFIHNKHAESGKEVF